MPSIYIVSFKYSIQLERSEYDAMLLYALNLKLTTQKHVIVDAPVTGRMFPLHEVQDEAFSQGYIGKGIAIDPTSGSVVAPVSGKIRHVIDTRHAILIEHSSGIQFLLHVGIDTVDLKGNGFHTFVKPGDTIVTGQTLMEFDLQQICAAGYLTHVLLIAIGDKLISDIECNYRQVEAAEQNICRIVLK